eukprot:3712282-Rhodomonas_salina.6
MGFIQKRFCSSGIACAHPSNDDTKNDNDNTRSAASTSRASSQPQRRCKSRRKAITNCLAICMSGDLEEEEAEEQVVNAVEPPTKPQTAQDHRVHRRVAPGGVPQWLSPHQRPLVSLQARPTSQRVVETGESGRKYT